MLKTSSQWLSTAASSGTTSIVTLCLLLTPSAPGEAPEGLATTGSATFNRRWSLLGLPCLTLPVMRGPRSLPVGVQLVGRWHDEARLLATAAFIERLVGWRA